MKRTLIAVLAGGLMALGAQAQVPPSTPAASYSEDELKAFVSAAAAIQRINADFEERVKAAMSEQEQRELVIAASIQQNVALSSRGFTPEKYQQIIERIDTDPAFAQKIEAQLKTQAR